MASLTTWLWGTSQLDDAVDKATSELVPAGSEDIALNLEICDQIRSKSVPAKDAMRALKRRLGNKNPNVQLLALGLTDVCVKNGGDLFLSEVASREFMDNLVSILKMPALNLDVRNAILRHVQNWSVAFEGKPSLGYVGQVYKILGQEGYKFPPKDLAVANSAMVDTQIAPEWIDSDVCLRCRTAFSFTNRKHHCRNCGQVFDQACSSKTMPLPHFGITQEVRVCDGCYAKLTKKAERSDKGQKHSSSKHEHRSVKDLADAELQRAIELSLQETKMGRSGYTPSQPPLSAYSEPPIFERSTHFAAVAEDEDDPDLRAAIEASLREASAPKPSAPVALETPRAEQSSYELPTGYGSGYTQQQAPYSMDSAPAHPALPAHPKIPNYDLEPLEEDAILTFSQTVEQVQTHGGRDISRYPAVTELYEKATGLRPKLAMSLDDASRKEEMLTEMHEKLSEAVKLYDQLLTQQISHPRWRSPQLAQVPPYQPPAATPGAPVNSYNQWSPASASHQPPETSTAQRSPQLSQYQPQYASRQPQWRPTRAAEQPYSIQQSQATTMVQPSQLTRPSSALPVSYVPQSPPIAPPASYQQTVSQAQQTFAPPLPPQQLQDTSLVGSPPYTPTPPVQQQQRPSIPHTLSRNNTLQPAQQRPQQQRPQHTPQQQHSYQQHPQMPIQQDSGPQLSQFPVAPTSGPTAYSLYGTSIPSGVAQIEERKEALLIDL
ncbi:ubiquitin binding protein [Pleurotus eryngii]|uniref:Vacuolar protein sorting-associated protein 27 n=1 Tax=Pleurotus eryngii TaxID=5323 RepID=A0A9P5ZW28_PLEER|nr:ubiquitin binding protein [Pleurotus eryngii]